MINPLHRAIIENHLVQLSDPYLIEKWSSVKDSLGFTPLEIARFLGNDQAVKLLENKLPLKFIFQPNGSKILELSLNAFEQTLNFRYRSSLTFSSYSLLREVIHQCPYLLRCPSLTSDNYAWTKHFQNELDFEKIAPISIRWIDSVIGYGAFAEKEIRVGAYVGEYTGVVRHLSRLHSDHNPYCFHYPTRFWSLKYFVIDSMREGNFTRFVNHSQHPNLDPLCLVDRGLLHQIFIANKVIKPGEQLTFNYGDDYWIKRKQVEVLGTR